MEAVEPVPSVPADQLAGFAAMTRAMQQASAIMQKALGALAAVNTKVDERLTRFEDQMQVEVVVPLQQRMGAIEAKQRDAILITPAERQEIREAVSGRAREFGGERIHFSRMYGRIHREFGIPSYEYLRAVDLPQALKYIAAYDGRRTTWVTQ